MVSHSTQTADHYWNLSINYIQNQEIIICHHMEIIIQVVTNSGPHTTDVRGINAAHMRQS